MRKGPSLHELILYNRDIARPEPTNKYFSHQEAAAQILQACMSRDGQVLARIRREVQGIRNPKDRNRRAVEIFLGSLHPGHLFPKNTAPDRRELAQNIKRYFGITVSLLTELDYDRFIDDLGKALSNEPLQASPMTEPEVR